MFVEELKIIPGGPYELDNELPNPSNELNRNSLKTQQETTARLFEWQSSQKYSRQINERGNTQCLRLCDDAAAT